jgi:ribonuclease P protein component
VQGRKVHMPGLLLVHRAAPAYKVAVVVGKKVTRSAVARNTLKRRLYATLYDMRVSKMPSGHTIIIAKPAANAYSYARLRTEVITALNRAIGFSRHSR